MQFLRVVCTLAPMNEETVKSRDITESVDGHDFGVNGIKKKSAIIQNWPRGVSPTPYLSPQVQGSFFLLSQKNQKWI